MNNPFLPDDGWNFPEVEVTPDIWWWFDPEYAVGYDYAVDGDAFTKIQLPGDPVGDNCYYISYIDSAGVEQTTTCVMGGEEFDLESLVAGGLTALTVSGIELASMIDPDDTSAFITGFQFASGGTIQYFQDPIVESTNVVAPGTLLLVGIALTGLAARARRRRRS